VPADESRKPDSKRSSPGQYGTDEFEGGKSVSRTKPLERMGQRTGVSSRAKKKSE